MDEIAALRAEIDSLKRQLAQRPQPHVEAVIERRETGDVVRNIIEEHYGQMPGGMVAIIEP